MKKKLLSILLIFGLVFVFSGCGQSYEDDGGLEPDGVEEEMDESEDMESGDVLELISRGTWDTEDASGYKVQGEIETTDLIRASDWDTVESTFDSFNSSNELPGFDAVSPDNSNQDTSAILVGTIELNNITDGWDFSESSPYECKLFFKAPDLYGNNFSSLCVMYGDGMQKMDFGGVRGYLDTNAVMNSNNWKVPFVIVIPEMFTPNEPDGSEKVFSTTLIIGGNGDGCEFTVPRLAE